MKTIAEIKAEFAAADMSSYPALYEIYKEDTRSGVQKLIAQCRKKEAALEAEKQRIENMKVYEHNMNILVIYAELMKWEEAPLQARLWHVQ